MNITLDWFSRLELQSVSAMKNKPTYRDLRTYLAALRMAGISQSDFAAEMGISPGLLSDLKNNNTTPSLRLALRLKERTGVPVESYFRSPTSNRVTSKSNDCQPASEQS